MQEFRVQSHFFNDDDPKYKCCCSNMHVKTGAKVILALGVVWLTIEVILLVVSTVQGDNSAFDIGAGIISILISLLVYTCLATAIRTENKRFTMPYLIWQVLFAGLVVTMIICSIIVLQNPSSALGKLYFEWGFEDETKVTTPEKDAKYLAIGLLSMSPFFLIVILWFGFTIYKYFVYLRDKENFEQ